MLKKLLALAAALGAASLTVHGSGSLPTARVAWTCPRTAVLTALPRSERSSGAPATRRAGRASHSAFTRSTPLRPGSGFAPDSSVGIAACSRWTRRCGSGTAQIGCSGWQLRQAAREALWLESCERASGRPQRVAFVARTVGMFDPPHLIIHFYGHQPTGSIPHGGFGGMLRPWPIR